MWKGFLTMVCLRCGHCCINYEVVIVNDPSKGIVESNLIAKHTGDRCQHLVGGTPGQYSCALHDYSWYEETPCYKYGQAERSDDTSCRMGVYLLKRKVKNESTS